MKISQLHLFFFVIFGLSLNTFAADPKLECEFTLKCKNQSEEFSLEFKSPSKDCFEDDGELTLINGASKSQKLSLKPDFYYYTPHIGKNLASICQSSEEGRDPFTAFPLGSHRVLLFIKSSGRPSYDSVNALVLDTKSGKVVDFKRLGSSRNNFIAVLKHPKGFKLRLIRDSLSFHKEVTCDCDAPFVDDWIVVSVKKDKIQQQWDKK